MALVAGSLPETTPENPLIVDRGAFLARLSLSFVRLAHAVSEAQSLVPGAENRRARELARAKLPLYALPRLSGCGRAAKPRFSQPDLILSGRPQATERPRQRQRRLKGPKN